jgi:hypothetical protein
MQEITDSIGMDQFNAQLQEYLERAMRAAATDALLEQGGVESVALTGDSKATMEMLRRELEQVKQALAKAQEETQKEVQETKQELAVPSAVQEVSNQRMAAIEANMDTLIGLLKPG